MAKTDGSVQYALGFCACVFVRLCNCIFVNEHSYVRVRVCVCAHACVCVRACRETLGVWDQPQTLKTVLISHFMENVRVIPSGFPL